MRFSLGSCWVGVRGDGLWIGDAGWNLELGYLSRVCACRAPFELCHAFISFVPNIKPSHSHRPHIILNPFPPFPLYPSIVASADSEHSMPHPHPPPSASLPQMLDDKVLCTINPAHRSVSPSRREETMRSIVIYLTLSPVSTPFAIVVLGTSLHLYGCSRASSRGFASLSPAPLCPALTHPDRSNQLSHPPHRQTHHLPRQSIRARLCP